MFCPNTGRPGRTIRQRAVIHIGGGWLGAAADRQGRHNALSWTGGERDESTPGLRYELGQ